MAHTNPRDDEESTWSSGIFKHPADGPVWVGKENLEGDGQDDLRVHGGADRAVLVFNRARYAHWEKALGIEIPAGGFGENLTIEGPDEDAVCLGDKWRCGDLLLEVSQPRIPCFKLGRRLDCPEIVNAVMDAQEGGWYCRALSEGPVQAGDVFSLEDRPHPEYTVRRSFDVFVNSKNGRDALAALGEVRALSQLWRDRIEKIVSARG